MKAKLTFLIMGCWAGLQAAAFAQSTNPPPTAGATAQLKPVYPALEYKLDAKTSGTESTPTGQSVASSPAQLKPAFPESVSKLGATKPGVEATGAIVNYGGRLSSQAWATTATRRDNPTVFHNLSTHEPQFSLLSVGHKPWQ